MLILYHISLLQHPSEPPTYIQSVISDTDHIKVSFTLEIKKIPKKKGGVYLWNTSSCSERSHVGYDQRLVLMIMKNWLIKALFNFCTCKNISSFSSFNSTRGGGRGWRMKEWKGKRDGDKRGKRRDDRDWENFYWKQEGSNTKNLSLYIVQSV